MCQQHFLVLLILYVRLHVASSSLLLGSSILPLSCSPFFFPLSFHMPLISWTIFANVNTTGGAPCPPSHTSGFHTVNPATPLPSGRFSHPPLLTANTPWHLIGISFTSPLLPLPLPLALPPTLPLHPSILQQAERAGTSKVENNRSRVSERIGVIESVRERVSETAT